MATKRLVQSTLFGGTTTEPAAKVARPEQKKKTTIPKDVLDRCVEYYPRAVSGRQCALWKAELKKLDLEQATHEKPCGTIVKDPHLSLAASTTGQPYSYVGRYPKIVPFAPVLNEIKAVVEALLARGENSPRFELALVLLYRDGQDKLGYHQDDGEDIDLTFIASFSLGHTRKFKMRLISDPSCGKDYDLANGDLLLMKAPCQELLEHSIPKVTSQVGVGERINVTFRCYKKR